MSEQIAEPGAETGAADVNQAQSVSDADAAMAEAMMEQAPLDDLNAETGVMAAGDENLNAILDIPISLSVVIGQTSISIRNLLQLNQGSVVELDRLAGEPLDVMVNNTLVAQGEVVVINDKYGIRLTDVISALDRVRNLQA